MNKSQLISELKSLGQKPKKKLGQNFLIDKNILDKIIIASELKKGDKVLEIGPGLGVLTQALSSTGAVVTFIEKDKIFAQRLLSKEFSIQNVTGICADASKLDFSEIMRVKSWKFISNLPYAITSLALRKALYTKNPPKILVALIQKEVAERIMAPVHQSKVSLLGLMCNLACSKIEIISRVSKNSFYPSPKVDSAIIKMQIMDNDDRIKKWGIDGEQIMQIAKKGFSHPRKLLQRNLNISGEMWQELAQRIGFDPKTRAEDLSVEQWALLAKNI